MTYPTHSNCRRCGQDEHLCPCGTFGSDPVVPRAEVERRRLADAQRPCSACGTTPLEATLGRQMGQMVAEARERKDRPATPDDPVELLRGLAEERGFDLVDKGSSQAVIP